MQILVLGMHRSGTSAVARLLNMMGAYFAPGELAMPATVANPKGHWERQDICALNDAVLGDLDLSWDNIADLGPDTLDEKLLRKYTPQARRIVLELDAHRPWMAKDPRFCLLLPLWRRLLEVPVYVYVYRDPLQIAQSLKTREGNFAAYPGSALYPLYAADYTEGGVAFPLSLGLALWEKYTLLSLRNVDDVPKILVSYHALMSDPVATVRALHAQLQAYEVRGLRLPSDREILAYIDPGLYHEKGDASLWNGCANQQQRDLYAACRENKLFDFDAPPELSPGAAESLREHRDRLRAARKVLAERAGYAEHLERQQQEITQQAQETERLRHVLETRDAELDAARRQVRVAEERAARHQEDFNKTLHALLEKDRLLSEKEHVLAEKDNVLAAQAQNIAVLNEQLIRTGEAFRHNSHHLQQLVYWLNGLEEDIDAVFASLTWRAGETLTRAALRLTLRAPERTAKDHIAEIRAHLAAHKVQAGLPPPAGTPAATARPGVPVPAHDPRDYALWVRQYDSLGAKALKALQQQVKSWQDPPLISLIMPTYNTDGGHLRAAIESVQKQVYPHWELCIADDASSEAHVRRILQEYAEREPRLKLRLRAENGHIAAASNTALEAAGGEFVAFLDHDDMLPPHALFCVAQALREQPEAMLLYSDEDKLDEQGRRHTPHFKPDWNPDLFLSYNFLNHLSVYRRSLVEELGGLRVGFEGAQDYDLALRAVERIGPARIVHIPRVLYHWRASGASTAAQETQKPYALQAAQRAIQEHLERTGIKGRVLDAPELLGANRVQYALPEAPPLISLIIPTRNQVDILRCCVDSILEKTGYPRYEILIVDNHSDDPYTLAYLRELEDAGKARVVPYPQPFNYAAINNMAVEHAQGELIGLLNNDVEVINPGWLTEMASHALRPGVGAVGARLWYPNDTLQHGGVIVGLGGVAGHSHKYFRRNDPGYFGRTAVVQNFSAVTAACLIMRKATYLEVGGMETEHLRVAFNDVDLCLKVTDAGLRIVWTPYADLYHHESISRGQEDTPEKIKRFQKECAYIKTRWDKYIRHDPAYSPNLTLDTEDFAYAWPPKVPPLGKHSAIAKVADQARVAAPAQPDEKPRAAPAPVALAQSQPPAAPPRGAGKTVPPHLAHRQAGYALLHGRGLEIGAFHQPAVLPEDCAVEYCDACSKEESARHFKELDGNALVDVQHVCDLDKADLPFADGHFDFVVCNHVLEHVANPVRVLAQVFRVVKPGGQVVVSVPDKRFNFDKGRALTSFQHVLDEYKQGVDTVSDGHYLDFLRAAHPGVFNLSPEEFAQVLENVRERREHAHVWDSRAFDEFMAKALDLLNIAARCVFISRGEENQQEYFSVWRTTSPGAVDSDKENDRV